MEQTEAHATMARRSAMYVSVVHAKGNVLVTQLCSDLHLNHLIRS